MKQAIGIPMGIDPATFGQILYSYKEEYISSLISSDKTKVRLSHATKQFIDE